MPRIEIENNGRGETCSIGGCGSGAVCNLKAPIKTKFATIELRLHLCAVCRAELRVVMELPHPGE